MGVYVRRLELPLPYDKAYERSLYSLLLISKARVRNEDRAEGMIFATVRINSKTFGDRISIVVTETGTESVYIDVSSRPVLRSPLLDYGANLDNVNKICEFLNA